MHIKKYPLRFVFIFLSFVFLLCFFSLKLVFIQIFHSSYLGALAQKQHNYFIELEPVRGTIYDRQLRPLAMNIPVYSLYANPRAMSAKDKQEALRKLPALLNIDPAVVKERLSKEKYFVWIHRKLPLGQAERIKQLNIKGLDFMDETRRYYPNGSLAAHVIGFAGMDNTGLEGIELSYNDYLKGQPGWSRILRDARLRELMIGNTFLPPRDGFNVVLTIDETIQYIAEHALEKAYKKHNAKAASIIVMDVRTGEILALANQPTYKIENFSSSHPESRTNRAIWFTYEPGSVFKIVTAAAALEGNYFTETNKIFCENGAYRIANHTLHDHHPHGTLTFREVFEQSSNIGVAKIAQKMGANTIYQYGRKFRFGMKTNIDLAGEVRGVLKPPSAWSKTTIGAIPMGQEVTVTQIQLLCAIAAIANDGVYMRPFVVKYIKDNHDEIIKSFEPEIVERVISSDVAKRLTDILVGVIEKGTGTLAKIKGVKVAGKTGTAQKVVNGMYSHSNFYATFFGFAPADHPRIAAIVVVDDPHPSYFGGTVAGPVFKEVVENTLKYLENSEPLALPQLVER